MKKLKKLFALSLAVAMFVCAMAFPASAASFGTKVITFKRDGVESTATCQLYNDALVKDDSGNLVSTNLYAYVMSGLKTSDQYATYVGFTYFNLDTWVYDEVACVPDATQGTEAAKAVTTVDYSWQDPIDGKGVFIINSEVLQMCRHFNDDSTADLCSHYYEYGKCSFDSGDVTWDNVEYPQ